MSTPTIPNSGRMEIAEGIARAVARAISTGVGGRFRAMEAAMIYPVIASYRLCQLLHSSEWQRIYNFNLVEGNGYLGSAIARRSRLCGLRFYQTLAIRPPASVKVVPAILNPEYESSVSFFHRISVK